MRVLGRYGYVQWNMDGGKLCYFLHGLLVYLTLWKPVVKIYKKQFKVFSSISLLVAVLHFVYIMKLKGCKLKNLILSDVLFVYNFDFKMTFFVLINIQNIYFLFFLCMLVSYIGNTRNKLTLVTVSFVIMQYIIINSIIILCVYSFEVTFLTINSIHT